jgi:hypothetical protein
MRHTVDAGQGGTRRETATTFIYWLRKGPKSFREPEWDSLGLVMTGVYHTWRLLEQQDQHAAAELRQGIGRAHAIPGTNSTPRPAGTGRHQHRKRNDDAHRRDCACVDGRQYAPLA